MDNKILNKEHCAPCNKDVQNSEKPTGSLIGKILSVECGCKSEYAQDFKVDEYVADEVEFASDNYNGGSYEDDLFVTYNPLDPFGNFGSATAEMEAGEDEAAEHYNEDEGYENTADYTMIPPINHEDIANHKSGHNDTFPFQGS